MADQLDRFRGDRLEGGLEQQVLTTLCFSDEHFLTVRNKITPEMFSLKAFQTIARKAVEYIDTYSQAPKESLSDLLENELRQDGSALMDKFLDEAPRIGVNPAYILDKLARFLRQSAIQGAIETANEALADEDFGAAETALRGVGQAALANGSGRLIVKSPEQIIEESSRRGLQTPIWGDVIKKGELDLIVGRPHDGKSTFAQALTRSLALGKPFLGVPCGVPNAPFHNVLYLALERNSYVDVAKHFGGWRIGRRRAYGFGTAGIVETASGTLDQLVAEIERLLMTPCIAKLVGRMKLINGQSRYLVEEVLVKPDLVIIDNLQDLLQIQKGNEYGQVSLAMKKLQPIITRTGKTIIALYHQKKGKKGETIESLGSVAFDAGAQTLIECTREVEGETSTYFVKAQCRGIELPRTKILIDQSSGEATYEQVRRGRPSTIDEDQKVEEFFREMLKDGPRPATETIAAAKVKDISPDSRSFTRVRKRMVKAYKDRSDRQGGWTWSLELASEPKLGE